MAGNDRFFLIFVFPTVVSVPLVLLAGALLHCSSLLLAVILVVGVVLVGLLPVTQQQQLQH